MNLSKILTQYQQTLEKRRVNRHVETRRKRDQLRALLKRDAKPQPKPRYITREEAYFG